MSLFTNLICPIVVGITLQVTALLLEKYFNKRKK